MKCFPNIDLFTLSGTFTGSAATAFPNFVQIDQLTFNIPYALVGVHVSSAYSLDTGASLIPVFAFAVVVNQPAARFSLSNSVTIVAIHASSIPPIGVPQVDAQATWVSFGEYGVRIPSGSPISLFASGVSGAASTATAVASLQMAAIK